MFTSDRLLFRALLDSDIERWYSMYNDLRIQRFITNEPVVPHPAKYKEVLKAKAESSTIWFSIELKDTGAFVGQCSVKVSESKNRDGLFEISIRPDLWGNGYGTEASKFMIGYAFEALGIQRVSLTVFEGNARAIAIYKKL